MSFKNNLCDTSFPNRLLLIAILVFVGNVIAVTVCFYNVHLLHLSYPYNTFLFNPNDRFMDFFNPLSASLSPYHFTAGHLQHMPFYYTLISIFRIIPAYAALGLIIATFLSGFSIIFYILLRRQNCGKAYSIIFIGILISSYPIITTLDRGNMEMLLCLAFFVTLLLFQRERYLPAALMLAVALSFKPFAIFLLPLFIWKKRYWECLLIPFITLLITVLSIAHFPGSIAANYHSWMHNLALYKASYTWKAEGIIGGNSIFGAIKLWLLNAYSPPHVFDFQVNIQPIAKTYFWGAAALTILIVYFVIRFRFEFWKKITLLICCMNMFPLVSGDYRLVHFFIPFYFWLSDSLLTGTDPKLHTTKRDLPYLLLFVLLFIPRNYYHFRGSEITSAAFTSPLIMILLTIFIFAEYYRNNHSPIKNSESPSLQATESCPAINL